METLVCFTEALVYERDGSSVIFRSKYKSGLFHDVSIDLDMIRNSTLVSKVVFVDQQLPYSVTFWVFSIL